MAGVRVQAVAPGGEIRTAETSEDGGARFEGLGREGTRTRAEAPDGRVTMWRSVQPIGTNAEASLRLLPGAVLAGEVVEAGTGTPIGGVVLSILEGGNADGLSTALVQPPFATVVTDASGAFGPVAVPRDLVVMVIARAPRHAALEREVAIHREGEVPRLRLAIEAGGVVTGVVLAPDRKPVAGAHVVAVSADYAFWVDLLDREPVPTHDTWGLLAAVADANGCFRIDRLPLGGRFSVLAWAEGWATSRPVADLVVAEDRPTAAADPVLRRLGRLDVLVRDPGDGPVAGARVTEVTYDGRFFGERLVPEGPTPGTYRLDRHFPGGISLSVLVPGFAPASENTEIGEGDSREITVRLSVAVSIRGVVLDDRELPVEGVTVSARQDGQLVIHHLGERPILTGPDGKFEVTGLAAGPHSLYASAWSARMQDHQTVDVEAPAEGVVLRLVREGEIRFRLRVPPGGPVPRELPYALSPGSFGVFNWLGEEFREGHLPPGPGRIRLFPPGYAALSLDFRVAPGETADLGEFLLDEGVVLRGRVADPSGKAVEGATVTLVLQQSMGDPHVSTGADGGFEIPHAERGANRLVVARDGFLRGEFTVPGEGATADSAFVLRRGGLLRVRVVDAAGRPAASVALGIAASGGAPSAGALPRAGTDFRGASEVRLPAGKYSVGAGNATSAEVVLAEGGTTDLTLKLR